MKTENIPTDIKSKSLKEAREEINKILSRLDAQQIDFNTSVKDYQRLMLLNRHVDSLFKKKFKEISLKNLKK